MAAGSRLVPTDWAFSVKLAWIARHGALLKRTHRREVVAQPFDRLQGEQTAQRAGDADRIVQDNTASVEGAARQGRDSNAPASLRRHSPTECRKSLRRKGLSACVSEMIPRMILR